MEQPLTPLLDRLVFPGKELSRSHPRFFFIGIYLLSFTLQASVNVPSHLKEHMPEVHLQFYIHPSIDWPFHVFVQSYDFNQHVSL